jgi:hypothetical protein
MTPRAWRLLLFALATGSCNATPAPKADPSTERRREEPIRFELDDWRPSPGGGTETGSWRHVDLAAPSGSCTVGVDRWWGLPPDTGGAAHEDSSRPVVVDGVPLRVSAMSLFEGRAQHVDALYIVPVAAPGSVFVRLVFRSCSVAEVDTLLAATRLSASLKGTAAR